ncbi:MAG: hypothetical protein HDS71_09815 [Bacteroidales bacterium]|nr:hypothetical protein [Bacteroidales bacterium]
MNPTMLFFYFTGCAIAIKGYNLTILYRWGKYCVVPALVFAILSVIAPDSTIGYLGCYVANFGVLYILSSFVFYVLKRVAPKPLSVMCGGRIY